MHVNVPLSRLVPSPANPRRAKPNPKALRRLVASVRTFGLLEPLVVRPADEDGLYEVVAGNRRLIALRHIHGDADVKVPCQVRKVDDPTAEAMGLAENFAREAMHPLDEAEAFSSLAASEGKTVRAVAAEFGVGDRYVRQRMKLAGLAGVVKASYRRGEIDTATAEAFAAVPAVQQEMLWEELNGHPRHAQQVRNLIDAAHAMFDVAALPASSVSQDLFHERTLVERSAFMAARKDALAARREGLIEDGWSEAVVAGEDEVTDRLYAMDAADRTFDDRTARRLARLQAVRAKLRVEGERVGEHDEAAAAALGRKLDAVAAKEREVIDNAPEVYSEAVKGIGTAFLVLQPDGRVQSHFLVPRASGRVHASTNGAFPASSESHNGTHADAEPPTSDELSDRQKAETFHRRTLAVRAALLKNAAVRKRLLLLILHEKVRSEALSVRHEPNATTLHAAHGPDGTEGERFACQAWNELRQKRSALDPFDGDPSLDDVPAYERLAALSDGQANQLIALLVAEHLTAHPIRATQLVGHLAAELAVDFRKTWRPDAAWLGGYRKCQLSHLLPELRGPTYSPAHETRKKSELVRAVADLFVDAAEGRLADAALAGRVNGWLPANLRGDEPATAG